MRRPVSSYLAVTACWHSDHQSILMSQEEVALFEGAGLIHFCSSCFERTHQRKHIFHLTVDARLCQACLRPFDPGDFARLGRELNESTCPDCCAPKEGDRDAPALREAV